MATLQDMMAATIARQQAAAIPAGIANLAAITSRTASSVGSIPIPAGIKNLAAKTSSTISSRQTATQSPVANNSPEIVPNKKMDVSSIPTVTLTKKPTNPLNKFRSYNYLFTLGCITNAQLIDPAALREKGSQFIVAKSTGKGNTVMQPAQTDVDSETAAISKELVDNFYKNSAGQFDMFINNVEIETLMGSNNNTNISIATQIKFEIFEPYSINGFIEALQVTAVAAGHVSYAVAPYVLSMQFIGYTNNDGGAQILEAEGSRDLVFSFTGLEVQSNESGTKYICNAVPFNERGFGDPNILKTATQITGTKVEEILDDLMKAVTEQKKDEASKIRKATSNANVSNQYDEYQIVFPASVDGKLDFTSKHKVANSDVCDLGVTQGNYRFATEPTAGTVHHVVGGPVTNFAADQKIHDCIAAILRDSVYSKTLLDIWLTAKDPPTDGMFDYFSINIEMIPKTAWDPLTNKPCYIYKYVVIPYKMHYTRIPLLQSKTVNIDKLNLLARREYNYQYTGKNVDIQRFNLKFDNLYFQAMPNTLATNSIFSRQTSLEGDNTVDLTKDALNKDAALIKRSQSPAPIISSPDSRNVNATGGNSRAVNYADSYDAMVKNMHQAILDNLGMVKADITILGDPFYLVSGGMTNYLQGSETYGETTNNEAAYQTGDVFIIVNFTNPIDIDPATGLMKFNKKLVPFGGVFRVMKVNSTFKDSLFEQRLELVRVPGQPIDTNAQPDTSVSAVSTVDVPYG